MASLSQLSDDIRTLVVRALLRDRPETESELQADSRAVCLDQLGPRVLQKLEERGGWRGPCERVVGLDVEPPGVETRGTFV